MIFGCLHGIIAMLWNFVKSLFPKLASGDCCHLLITFANSLDPDQD